MHSYAYWSRFCGSHGSDLPKLSVQFLHSTRLTIQSTKYVLCLCVRVYIDAIFSFHFILLQVVYGTMASVFQVLVFSSLLIRNEMLVNYHKSAVNEHILNMNTISHTPSITGIISNYTFHTFRHSQLSPSFFFFYFSCGNIYFLNCNFYHWIWRMARMQMRFQLCHVSHSFLKVISEACIAFNISEHRYTLISVIGLLSNLKLFII